MLLGFLLNGMLESIGRLRYIYCMVHMVTSLHYTWWRRNTKLHRDGYILVHRLFVIIEMEGFNFGHGEAIGELEALSPLVGDQLTHS
jgi:hypothetical protein